jgi:hypothetical protein
VKSPASVLGSAGCLACSTALRARRGQGQVVVLLLLLCCSSRGTSWDGRCSDSRAGRVGGGMQKSEYALWGDVAYLGVGPLLLVCCSQNRHLQAFATTRVREQPC